MCAIPISHLMGCAGAFTAGDRMAFRSLSAGCALVIDETVQRLESQSKDMKEYIRKNNWTYRDEKLTEEEDTAWRKTLGFFTGYPGESFTYKVDE